MHKAWFLEVCGLFSTTPHLRKVHRGADYAPWLVQGAPGTTADDDFAWTDQASAQHIRLKQPAVSVTGFGQSVQALPGLSGASVATIVRYSR